MANPSQISLFGFEEEAPVPKAAEPAATKPAEPSAAPMPAEPSAAPMPAEPVGATAVDGSSTPEPSPASDPLIELSADLAEQTTPVAASPSDKFEIEITTDAVDSIEEEEPILKEDAPIVVVLRDETAVAFEGPKKRGRKKREQKWVSDTPGKRGRKSLSDAAAMADLVEIPADEILFQKQYYSMGEICDMFRMNPSHVRIWSREFESHLQLKKNKKGDRFFRPDDVKTLHFIHHLIRERKYTINGAREFLKQQQKGAKVFDLLQSLEKIKSFLLELKAGL